MLDMPIPAKLNARNMDNKKRVLYREPRGKSSRRYFNNCDGWSDSHRAAKKFKTYGEALQTMLRLEGHVVGVRIGRI